MMTKARTPGTSGAMVASSGTKVVSAQTMLLPASFSTKAMSSGAKRGLTVWIIAPMPETA